MSERTIQAVIAAKETRDGDGVKIHRIANGRNMALLDPFLLIDEIAAEDSADYLGGFPEHPHRGFETVTYMLEGRMRHRDHTGAEGVIGPGDVQWMTAGRGVLHSEMPEQEQGRMHGFQLWVNLPAKEKFKPAHYQEIPVATIPSLEQPGYVAKVIAGDFAVSGATLARGPVEGIASKPIMLDLQLNAGAEIVLDLEPQHTALVKMIAGAVTDRQSKRVSDKNLAQLSPGSSLYLRAEEEPSRFLLLAGAPFNEPIAHWGPFVMNTQEQLQQAIQDMYNGKIVAA